MANQTFVTGVDQEVETHNNDYLVTAVVQQVEEHKSDWVVTEVVQEVEYHVTGATVTEVVQQAEYHVGTGVVTEVVQEVEEHVSSIPVTSLMPAVEWVAGPGLVDVVVTSIVTQAEYAEGGGGTPGGGGGGSGPALQVTSQFAMLEYLAAPPPTSEIITPDTSPVFRVFWQDCEVRVKDWGSPEGYRIIKPLGGPSQEPDSGAKI